MSAEQPVSDSAPPVEDVLDSEAALTLFRRFAATTPATCPLCRYDLHGLTAPVCPECGSELTLRIGLEQPRLAPHLTGTVMLALAAGGAWIFLFLFIFLPGAPRDIVAMMFGQMAVATPALIIWVTQHRRIRRLRRGVQWTLAGLAGLLFPIFIVLDVLTFN